MRVEIPEFKRCCCCVPLRYGLLAWVYIDTVYLLLTLLMISELLYKSFYLSVVEIVIQQIALFLAVLDVVFNIVFLVGAHTKNIKLIKVQYRYNMVAFLLSALLATANILDMVIRYHEFITNDIVFMATIICAPIVGIVMQLYMILLTRSEIRKLANTVEFRFENNVAEEQCIAIIADVLGSTDPFYNGVPPA